MLRSAPLASRHAPVAALQDMSFVTPITQTAVATASAEWFTHCMGVFYALCDLIIPFNIGLALVAVLYSIFLPHWPLFSAVASSPLPPSSWQGVSAASSTVAQHNASGSQAVCVCDRAIANGGFVAIFLLRLIPTPIPALNF